MNEISGRVPISLSTLRAPVIAAFAATSFAQISAHNKRHG